MSRAIPPDVTTLGVVARYVALTRSRPTRMRGEAGRPQITHRSDAIHPRHQSNFRVFDPLDFLAEVSAHIPDAYEKTTLFYGWYFNRTRGYPRQHGLLAKAEAAAPPPGTDHRAPPGGPPLLGSPLPHGL